MSKAGVVKVENLTKQFSIILGAMLILIGIIIIVKKSSSRKLQTTGIICLGIGVIAIISGLIQI